MKKKYIQRFEIHFFQFIENICLRKFGLNLTRLRLTLNHFKEKRFHHNSGNCINPLYTSSSEDEYSSHFFSATITLILLEIYF